MSKTIYFMPLSEETSFELTNLIIGVLRQEFTLLGIPHDKNFSTDNGWLRFLRFLKYIVLNIFALVNNKNRISAIFCVHWWYGLFGQSMARWFGVPFIFDLHSGLIDRGSSSGILGRIGHSMEVRLAKKSNLVIVRTISDQAELLKRTKSPILVFPDCVDFNIIEQQVKLAASLRDVSIPLGRQRLIFSGSRRYWPNREAAFYINCTLMPEISRSLPDVVAIVTGDGPVPKHVFKSVIFTGHVNNYFKLLSESDIVLAPMTYANGTLHKIVEALALGKPLIATRVAVAGFDMLKNGYHLLVVNSRPEIADKIKLLLTNKEFASRLGECGREAVYQYYNVKTLAPSLLEAVSKCVGS
jgi:glycosyltransferase involved in cell wall biosynthesis